MGHPCVIPSSGVVLGMCVLSMWPTTSSWVDPCVALGCVKTLSCQIKGVLLTFGRVWSLGHYNLGPFITKNGKMQKMCIGLTRVSVSFHCKILPGWHGKPAHLPSGHYLEGFQQDNNWEYSKSIMRLDVVGLVLDINKAKLHRYEAWHTPLFFSFWRWGPTSEHPHKERHLGQEPHFQRHRYVE